MEFNAPKGEYNSQLGIDIVFKSTVIHLNETVQGNTCLSSKTSLIWKQKNKYFARYIPLHEDFIICYKNA